MAGTFEPATSDDRQQEVTLRCNTYCVESTAELNRHRPKSVLPNRRHKRASLDESAASAILHSAVKITDFQNYERP